MFRNLTQNPPPPALISQYLPVAYAALRDGLIGGDPARTRHGACLDGARRLSCGDDAGERDTPMAKLGRDEDELKALGALWTAREIEQQPAMLRETHADVGGRQGCARAVSCARCSAAAGMRVILTGAGTSAFIGECLAPYLAAKLPCRVEAIATTDLVSAPYLYFEQEHADAAGFVRPLRQQSGKRRGDRSRRPVRRRHSSSCDHLQCRRARWPARFGTAGNGIAILLPRGDARPKLRDDFELQLHDVCGACRAVRHRRHERADRSSRAGGRDGYRDAGSGDANRLPDSGYERVVYLGSHIFKGLAREAALKLLELTDGGMIAVYRLAHGFPAWSEDHRQRPDTRRDLPVQSRLYAPLRSRSAGRDSARRQARRPAGDLRPR